MPVLYLIPGLGADHHMFNGFEVKGYELRIVRHQRPGKFANMNQYAKQLADQIDVSKQFSILGVSIGGMLAVEMGKFLKPQRIILVGSAKTSNELPLYLRFFRYFPVYFLLPGFIIHEIAKFVFTYIETSSTVISKVVREMIDRTDPVYIRRSIYCIVNWDNKEVPKEVIHFHGTCDRIILPSGVNNVVWLKGAGHLMMMTHVEKLNEWVKNYLMNESSGSIPSTRS